MLQGMLFGAVLNGSIFGAIAGLLNTFDHQESLRKQKETYV